jgi:hypothetical protein
MILGYGLAMPILFRFSWVVERQHRLALLGHELGMLLAAAGWVARGQILVAVAHALWIVLANLWFRLGRPQPPAA